MIWEVLNLENQKWFSATTTFSMIFWVKALIKTKNIDSAHYCLKHHGTFINMIFWVKALKPATTTFGFYAWTGVADLDGSAHDRSSVVIYISYAQKHQLFTYLLASARG